ncbi:ATP-binding protein [Halovivax gelatinilyticus]|uniref:ATP-binding protein n=1 Tax=Halovivax gelatinilyticus TaxID=2961597 RepID=UPI0020CA87ED|nr:AAA family ATPase [Halovivax gelatinilyticus]
MTTDAGDALLSDLHEHNPWWETGAEAFTLPARQKSDFYHLARPGADGSQFEDQPVLALVGRSGAGKTTLLYEFIRHRIDAGDDPTRFLYLPFDADPLYQLHSDDQLRRAVRYYESRVLGRGDANGSHFIILDAVHRIEHSTKPDVDGWGSVVAELLEDAPDRHVAVTASSEIQIQREFDRADVPSSAYAVQPILPEKFRDYIFALYPNLEANETTRISPTSIRTGDTSLPTAVERGDPDALVEELRSKHQQVADDERRIQSRVIDYLAMGGVISYAQAGVVESADDLHPDAYESLREDVKSALYREIPGFESIKTIDDLERLCALAARNCGAEPIDYRDLTSLLDVDRRTIADSYLPALSELYLLTGVTEYDNQRPRSVRLYLRDTGLATALTGGDAASVRGDFDREADLARIAGFDHTMRFAYGLKHAQNIDTTPTVQYWRGSNGEVDFVFELNETPIPIGLAYRPGTRESAIAAIQEFQTTYDSPLGIVLVGDTPRGEPPIETLEDGIIKLPYWLYLLLC